MSEPTAYDLRLRNRRVRVVTIPDGSIGIQLKILEPPGVTATPWDSCERRGRVAITRLRISREAMAAICEAYVLILLDEARAMESGA